MLGEDDHCTCSTKTEKHYRRTHGQSEGSWKSKCKVEGCTCTSWNYAGQPLKKSVIQGLKILGIITSLILLFNFVISPAVSPYFQQVAEEQEERREFWYDMRYKVLYSDDCNQIQNGLSSLLSSGANSDSWFPNRDDSALKNGLERYQILC